MSAARLAVATGALIAAFVLSFVVGALLARVFQPQPTAPAVGIATPSPIATAATPRPQPTETPSPIATAVATPTPAPPNPTPVADTPTTQAVPTLQPATAEEFAAELNVAIREHDTVYLGSRLHPAVIARYGQQQCEAAMAAFGTDVTWRIRESAGPAPWDFVTDEMSTTVADAWAVTVRQAGAEPPIRDLHFAPADGTWRWFTDCGDPT